MYARNDVTRSRSTFFSIASCAVAGLLLFQVCLNVFGATDILPFTGVTLPFISSGGSSMMACWGLLAFIKASDERTYAVKRVRKSKYEEDEEDFPLPVKQSRAVTPPRGVPSRYQPSGKIRPRRSEKIPEENPLPDDISPDYAEKFNRLYRKDK